MHCCVPIKHILILVVLYQIFCLPHQTVTSLSLNGGIVSGPPSRRRNGGHGEGRQLGNVEGVEIIFNKRNKNDKASKIENVRNLENVDNLLSDNNSKVEDELSNNEIDKRAMEIENLRVGIFNALNEYMIETENLEVVEDSGASLNIRTDVRRQSDPATIQQANKSPEKPKQDELEQELKKDEDGTKRIVMERKLNPDNEVAKNPEGILDTLLNRQAQEQHPQPVDHNNYNGVLAPGFVGNIIEGSKQRAASMGEALGNVAGKLPGVGQLLERVGGLLGNSGVERSVDAQSQNAQPQSAQVQTGILGNIRDALFGNQRLF